MVRDIYTPEEAGSAAASEVVRRWDQALVFGPVAGLAVMTLAMLVLWLVGTTPTMGRWDAVEHGMGALRYAATRSDMDWLPWGELKRDTGALWRLVVATLLGSGIGWWVGALAARPMSRVRHIEGPRLLEGNEAIKTACRRSRKDGWMRLHPLLNLPKKHWTRHMLVVGSPGGGKTQVLWPIVRQLSEMGSHGRKTVILDVKGDWTAALPEAALINPWDARSYVWDIAADLNTSQAIQVFAQSLIPSKEGDFWSGASQQIVSGLIHKLAHDKQHHKKPWGWPELAASLVMDPYELKDLLLQHYPPGARLMEDPSSTTALNVLQTVVAHTQIVQQLAVAWGGEGRKKIIFRRWARDDYQGRRQIILAEGPDSDMSSRYIAAILNTLIPNIISPALADNEEGRTLAFVLDEFTSVGKINIAPLIEIGRSKGCTVILGFQALDQVKARYGNDFANGLMSMVGTHIVCQTALGETQNALANLFGRRRVALTNNTRSAQGWSVGQHEEQRQVVAPSFIGQELGITRRKHRFWIKAIYSIGGDPMVLTFEGQGMPRLREPFVPAAWTKGLPKREPVAKAEENIKAGSARLSMKPKVVEEKQQAIEPEDRLAQLAKKHGLRP
jgi:hypothetical protein